jgi:hypothetical protein
MLISQAICLGFFPNKDAKAQYILEAGKKLIMTSTRDIRIFNSHKTLQLNPIFLLYLKFATTMFDFRELIKKLEFSRYRNMVTSWESDKALAILTTCLCAPPDPKLSITIRIFR